MSRFIKIISSFFIITLLSACAGQYNRAQTGTLAGGALGGIVGSKFGKGSGQLLATGFGAVLGAYFGNQIGAQLDEKDRMQMAASTQNALEFNKSGQTTSWQNPDSGHSGKVKPVKTYQRNDGRYCREFSQQINIDGKPHQAYGTACRQPDGKWEIVN